METANPQLIQTNNAIMFADGETWYKLGNPNASMKDILIDYKACGGNASLTTLYPGLKFGKITATIQQYADCLTTGLKDFFTSAGR